MKDTLLEIIRREGLTPGKDGKKRFVNLFRLTTNPVYLRIIAQSLIDLMRDKPDLLASPSIESDPVVTALSLEAGLPFVFVHGGKIVYGEVKSGASIDVIADVVLTGKTALSTVMALKDFGRVDRVYAVVDLERGALERLSEEGVELIPLIKIVELGI